MDISEDNPGYMCPICGFDALEELPYERYGDPVLVGPHVEPLEVGAPTHEICPSCGFHFGCDDEMQLIGVPGGMVLDKLTRILRRWRALRIAEGMRVWSSDWRPLPPGWDPVAQLRRLGRDVATDGHP
jgi:hypothetical protein